MVEIKSSLVNDEDFKYVKQSIVQVSEIDHEEKFRCDVIEYINDSSYDSNDEFFYNQLEAVRFLDPSEDAIAFTTPDKRIYLNSPGSRVGKNLRVWEFIYDHECLHQLWDTFGVADKIQKEGHPYDHDILNIASDCVINDWLRTSRKKEPFKDGIFPEYLKERFGIEYNRKEDTQYSLYLKLMEKQAEIKKDEKLMKEIADMDKKLTPKQINKQSGLTPPQPPGGQHSDDFKRGWTDAIKDVLNGKIDPVKDTPNPKGNDEYNKGYNEAIKNMKEGLKNGINMSDSPSNNNNNNSSGDLPDIPWDIPQDQQQGGDSSDNKSNDKPNDADSAQDAANDAQDVADKAQDEANKAQNEADKAKANGDQDADKKQQEANQKKKAAKDAQKHAKDAQKHANDAQDAQDAGDSKGEEEAAKKAKDAADKAKESASKAGVSGDSSDSSDSSLSPETAEDAQEQANQAQDAADKAKAEADKAKANGDKDASKKQEAAKRAQAAADEAKEAANDAKEAQEAGNSEVEEEAAQRAKKAADEAKEAARETGVDRGEVKNQQKSKSGKPGKQVGNLITSFEEPDEITKRLMDNIEKARKKLAGTFGEFISKCNSSKSLEKTGLVAKTNHGHRGWNVEMNQIINAYVKKVVFNKKRQFKKTYQRIRRGSGAIKFGQPINPGKKVLKDNLDITTAFYIDKSGSMGNDINNVFDATYVICDVLKKQFSKEKVVSNIEYKLFAFDYDLKKLKFGERAQASGGTMPCHELLNEIKKNTPDYMINVIITDAEMDFNESEIIKLLKELDGIVVFITNQNQDDIKKISNMQDYKTKLYYIQATSDFKLE